MALTITTATQAYPGETVCGDTCGFWQIPNGAILAVCDGLGHGQAAAEASQAAIQCIAENLHASCDEMFLLCDDALRSTRGAALAIATINLNANQLTIGTVGNIRTLLLRNTKDIRLGGARGIVGAGFSHLQPETIDLLKDDILLLFSDGFDEFPAFRSLFNGTDALPETILQQMMLQFARPDDDASILLYKHA